MIKMLRCFLRIYDIGIIGYFSFIIKYNFIFLFDDFGLYVKLIYFFFYIYICIGCFKICEVERFKI